MRAKPGTGRGAKCINCWDMNGQLRRAIAAQERRRREGLPVDLAEVERCQQFLRECRCKEAA